MKHKILFYETLNIKIKMIESWHGFLNFVSAKLQQQIENGKRLRELLLKIQVILFGRKAVFQTEDWRKTLLFCNPISYLKAQKYVQHF